MVDIANSYDANAEPQSFDVIPDGNYTACIVESRIDYISTKTDKGRCLALTWKVQSGEHNGKLIWQRLNMWATNMNNLDKVLAISQSQFAEIRQATGKLTPTDTSELHHIPCLIRVAVRKDPNGVYNDQNEVKRVMPVKQPPAGQQGRHQPPAQQQTPQHQQPAPQQQAASQSGDEMPWDQEELAS